MLASVVRYSPLQTLGFRNLQVVFACVLCPFYYADALCQAILDPVDAANEGWSMAC